MSYRDRHPDVLQEEDRIPAGPVLRAIAVVVIVSAILLVWTAQTVAASYADLRPSGRFPELALGPRRPVARVRQDLFSEGYTEGRAARRALDTFGWADRERRLVRVPIDVAVDLAAEGVSP
jgi:hypothetical protein